MTGLLTCGGFHLIRCVCQGSGGEPSWEQMQKFKDLIYYLSVTMAAELTLMSINAIILISFCLSDCPHFGIFVPL